MWFGQVLKEFSAKRQQQQPQASASGAGGGGAGGGSGGSGQQSSGKKSKQPIALNIADMIDALEVCLTFCFALYYCTTVKPHCSFGLSGKLLMFVDAFFNLGNYYKIFF